MHCILYVSVILIYLKSNVSAIRYISNCFKNPINQQTDKLKGTSIAFDHKKEQTDILSAYRYIPKSKHTIINKCKHTYLQSNALAIWCFGNISRADISVNWLGKKQLGFNQALCKAVTYNIQVNNFSLILSIFSIYFSLLLFLSIYISTLWDIIFSFRAWIPH